MQKRIKVKRKRIFLMRRGVPSHFGGFRVRRLGGYVADYYQLQAVLNLSISCDIPSRRIDVVIGVSR